MVVYLLMFQLLSGSEFLGGEYQDEATCMQRAQAQLSHWRRVYGQQHIRYRCIRRPYV